MSVFSQIKADRFAAVRGAMVTGRLPLKETVVNEILAAMLRERDTPVKQMEMRFQAGGRFTLHLTPKVLFFTPQIKLDFDIEPEVNFRGDGTLQLRSLGLLGGPTAGLVRNVLLRVLKLPANSIAVSGSVVKINLRDALIERGAGEYVPLLYLVRLSTRPGALIVAFHLVADEK